MKNLQALLSLILLVSIVTVCPAANSEDLAKQNAEMQKKIDQLDKELESLKKAVGEQTGQTMEELPKPVWSNLDIQLYGYLKLDAAYDTSQIENGDYAKWVKSESTDRNDDDFNMTARESRLGMLINGPDNGEMKSSGRVEVDFFGPGVPENQARIMMRHAYLKLDWPEERFNIIAGQTSDVISPLYPHTVNYSVGWWTGNIGYRRPQIRLTKELGFVTGGYLKLEGAVTRTFGRTDKFAADPNMDTGSDSGFPTLQGRASITGPMFGAQEATIGVSGHWGQEEYDTDVYGRDKKFDTWSLNLDYTQPVCSKVEIQTELFTGANLSAYLGGIGQGVTFLTDENKYKEVGSKGGWVAASLGPWGKKKFNVGVAVDDVDRNDVNVGGRTLNRSVFGNVYYALNKQTDVAFELSHWRTEYRGPGDGESLRAQLAFIYKF
jgi:hypothetical protein